MLYPKKGGQNKRLHVVRVVRVQLRPPTLRLNVCKSLLGGFIKNGVQTVLVKNSMDSYYYYYYDHPRVAWPAIRAASLCIDPRDNSATAKGKHEIPKEKKASETPSRPPGLTFRSFVPSRAMCFGGRLPDPGTGTLDGRLAVGPAADERRTAVAAQGHGQDLPRTEGPETDRRTAGAEPGRSWGMSRWKRRWKTSGKLASYDRHAKQPSRWLAVTTPMFLKSL